jgi:hypothetical protein
MSRARWLSNSCLKSAIPLLVLFSMVGCDQFHDPPNSSPPAPVTVITTPVTISPFLIDVTEAKIRRSTAFRLDGDLRPVWTVTGRLRNLSSIEIKSVSLKIGIFKKSDSEVVDEAILVIDMDLLPSGIGSFSRDIQILPPESPWGWSCEPIKVIQK